MAYNITWMDSANTLFDVFQNVNDSTSQVLSLFFLILIYLVAYSVSSSNDGTRSFIISSFLVSIISALLWYQSLIAWYIAFIPVLLLCLSLFMEYIRN